MGHDFAGIRQARQHWGQHRALGGGHVGGDPTTTTTDIFGILFPTSKCWYQPRRRDLTACSNDYRAAHSSTTTTTTTTSTPHTLLPVTSASTTSTTTSSSTSTTSSTTTSSRVSSTHTSSTATSSSSSFHLETPTTTASPHTVAVTVSAAVLLPLHRPLLLQRAQLLTRELLSAVLLLVSLVLPFFWQLSRLFCAVFVAKRTNILILIPTRSDDRPCRFTMMMPRASILVPQS
ncbi:hypothetical protein CPB85DRAFT_742890 [Mucidula mucida]|nr:hypothetical protein CPB85DRAFT_742890 [Mucidula mucida]